MATRTWARLFSSAAAVALSAALAGSAAAVPSSIAYVGQLRTLAGPVNGAVNVSVTIWDSATGGSAVWGPQTWDDHAVMSGVLRLNIGGGGMPSLDGVLQTYPELWVQFTVDGDELGGRQAIGAAPFAIIAGDADRLGGVPASDYVTNAAFAAAAASASYGAVAPASPAAGQLWFNTGDQTLYAWDTGSSSWVGVSVGDAGPSDLPTNGLGALSSGMLTNTFKDVSHLWAPAGGVPIEDATIAGNGAPAIGTVEIDEAAGGYITGIQVFTNFNLTSGNVIEMKLIPPAGMGAEMVLYDQALSFGTYGDVWNLSNTPGLAELLEKNPSGTWTLAVIDKDNNLAAPTTAGNLNSFEVRYDIVRSDHVAANGLLEVDTIVVHDELTADTLDSLDLNGQWVMKGDLRAEARLSPRKKLRLLRGQEQRNSSTGFLEGRTTQFEKHRDDTTLRITWRDNYYANTTNAVQIDFEIDGKPCAVPRPIRFHSQVYNSSQGYMYQSNTWVGYCERLQGDSEDIAAGSHELKIRLNHNSPIFGWTDTPGSIVIEEVY